MKNLNKILNYSIVCVAVIFLAAIGYSKREKFFPGLAETKKPQMNLTDLDKLVNKKLVETTNKMVHNRYMAEKAEEESKRKVAADLGSQNKTSP